MYSYRWLTSLIDDDNDDDDDVESTSPALENELKLIIQRAIYKQPV